jgi:hypothetical protein
VVAFVQHASNTGNGVTTLTVTLGSATTAGNCLIANITCENDTSITSIKLGTSADNWASQVANSTYDCYQWADPDCAGGQTSVVITFSGSEIPIVDVYEFSGLLTSSPLDKSNGTGGSAGTSAAWTSGASGTTTQAAELVVGFAGGWNAANTNPTITPPSSPWANATLLGSGPGTWQQSGYQIVAATGSYTYNGTSNMTGTNNEYAAAIGTYKAAPGGARSAAQTVTPSQAAAASTTGGHASAAQTVAPSQSAAASAVRPAAASQTVSPSQSAAAGAPSPVVQQAQGSTTGESLTLTFGENTTPGNAVIIAVCGYFEGAISAITLGGVGSTFTKQAGSGGYNAEIWANLSIAQASTTLVITASVAGIIAYAYEVSPGPGIATVTGSAATLNRSAGTYGGGTSWSSGATATTPVFGGQQLAIGLGFTIGSAGAGGSTITGPSSGWSDETAITDVVGADSYPLGGVSGYQLFAAPAQETATYAGTTGTSESWAGVVATFLLTPAMVNSVGWGGVVFSEHSSYTSVSATWTVPSLSGESGSACSIWVGLGDVQQAGVYCTYVSGDVGGNDVGVWTCYMPGFQFWDSAAFPAAAGDVFTVTVAIVSPLYWHVTITNTTKGWSYTQVIGTQAVQITIDGQGFKYPEGQAVVIIEKEGGSTDPDYGSVAFTNVTTIPAVTQEPAYLLTVNNANIDQGPGVFSVSGESFTMYWNDYD